MSLTIDLYENYLYIISIFTFHKSDLFYLILLSNHYIVKKKDLFPSINISEWKNEINEILFILWYKKYFYIKLKYILKCIVKYFIFIAYIF